MLETSFSKNIHISIQEKLQVSPFIHPTNSCYGIGGNIYQESVYKRIYELKGRDISKPFFITIPNIDIIEQIGVYDARIGEFIQQYPDKTFTFIVPRDNKLPEYINPGCSTVGIQVAKGPLLKLFQNVDFPMFGTSANISGQEPIYTSEEIRRTFGAYQDIVFLDGGDLEKTSPSTIIDLTSSEYKILRGSLE